MTSATLSSSLWTLATHPLFLAAVAALIAARVLIPRPKPAPMSRPLTKSAEKALITEFRDVTGANSTDATKWLKKHKYNLNGAINAYFSADPSQASSRDASNKVGEIWERFKDASDPRMIKIDGTLALSEELGIDPSSDIVLFCLAADLGSKAVGEFEKEPFVQGWREIDPSIDSIGKMKNALPSLRKKLNTDSAYFKKVYMHTFDLSKKDGARSLQLDTALDMWNLFIPPALHASPSALSKIPAGSSPTGPATDTPAEFGDSDLEMWLDFQRERGKAVSKDTWSLLIDFIRTIDSEYKEYDETAAWPSTIDDFVEYARAKRR